MSAAAKKDMVQRKAKRRSPGGSLSDRAGKFRHGLLQAVSGG